MSAALRFIEIMIIRLIFVTLILLKSNLASSQKEAYNWYFGHLAGITFHSDPPGSLMNGQLLTNEGCASISDSLGNLLFYTNGVQVWNRAHSIMPNGDSLWGDFSSTQCLIVPYPEKKNLYYIFTTPPQANYINSSAAYSIVDMDLQAGSGDVITKNVSLFSPSTEKLTAVRHQNNIDTWLIAHSWNSNTFYTYLLTRSGINTNPVISHAGTVHAIVSPLTGHSAIGYMKASPDGSKLALAVSYLDLVELFDFNNSTGIVSNPVVLSSGNSLPYGIEFSSDGKKLYCSFHEPGKIFQYDLNAGSALAIVNSMQVIYSSSSLPPVIFGALQIGPDEKIYVSYPFHANLGVINNPNAEGAGCDYSHGSFSFNSGSPIFGLPGFIANYFFPFDYRFACYEDSTEFYLRNSVHVDSVYWNFGDPLSGIDNISKNLSPKHSFSNSGTYLVTLIRYINSNSDTISKEITINRTLEVDLGNDASICPGAQITFDLTKERVTYVWQDNSTFPTYSASVAGTYWVKATDYCGTDSDTIVIIYHPVPVVDLGDDTTLCTGAFLLLDVTQFNSIYQWQDGSTNSGFNVTSPGQYYVEVANSFNCSKGDTITVNYLQPPEVNLGNDTIWCSEIPLILNAYNPQSVYLWQDNSSGHNYNVGFPGEYNVYVENICGSDRDTIEINFRDCSIFIPNLITPGNDQYNDKFIIKNIEVWKGSLDIYNRWGEKVYSNENYKNDWPGENLSNGIYFFYFKDGKGKEWKGWVEVLQ